MTSKEFYGTDYKTNMYVCRPCDARVGTHRNSKTPLGTMANAELRGLRRMCHALIDPYWKRGKLSRSEVYRRLGKYFNLTPKETHIGMFDEAKCRQLLALFAERGVKDGPDKS